MEKRKILCKTWVIQRAEYNGTDIETDIDDGGVVIFSKAGTVLFFYDGDENTTRSGEWKWTDEKETEFNYSWSDWTDNWKTQIGTIDELTDSTLVFHDPFYKYYCTLKKRKFRLFRKFINLSLG